MFILQQYVSGDGPSLFSVFLQFQARKLGCLLKEGERRREELQSELGNQGLEVERCKSDIEELLKHNARLQRDSDEHQTLKGVYNTLLNRSRYLMLYIKIKH